MGLVWSQSTHTNTPQMHLWSNLSITCFFYYFAGKPKPTYPSSSTLDQIWLHHLVYSAEQGRRKVWKSGGASSNVVGIICPFNWSAKIMAPAAPRIRQSCGNGKGKTLTHHCALIAALKPTFSLLRRFSTTYSNTIGRNNFWRSILIFDPSTFSQDYCRD